MTRSMPAMKMQKIREIARKMGIEAAGKSKTDLVRAIQKAEGYCACFASPGCTAACGEKIARWRRTKRIFPNQMPPAPPVRGDGGFLNPLSSAL
jgi:hypothetical protein